MFRKALLSLGAAALLASSAHAAELIQNGGFETPGSSPALFDQWSVSGDGIGDDTVFPNNGNNDALFSYAAGDPGTAGTLSQTVTTTATGDYTLSFYVMDEGPGTFDGETFDTFTASFGGYSQTITFGLDPTTPFVYQLVTAVIDATQITGPSTTLSFQGQIGDPNFAPGAIHLDDVSLTAETGGGGGVPEPGSWALMIVGFGLAGAALRWRNVRGQTAA